MDILDRYQEEIERLRERQALHGGSPHATRADEEQKVRHQITIIGCIRGIDGWYRCGFDEERKQIVPLERIEKFNQLYRFECSVCRDLGINEYARCFSDVSSDTYSLPSGCPENAARPKWNFIDTYPPTPKTMKRDNA